MRTQALCPKAIIRPAGKHIASPARQQSICADLGRPRAPHRYALVQEVQHGSALTASGRSSIFEARGGARDHSKDARIGSRTVCASTAGQYGEEPVDVISIANLCVDVVQPVDQLPPEEEESRKRAFRELTAAPPPSDNWEVGGACNFLIAAARLGLKCSAFGHVGTDVYGSFLGEVCAREGIAVEQFSGWEELPAGVAETLVVWVFVDPGSAHMFCSRFDFFADPYLEQLSAVPPPTQAAIRGARAIFMNGFVFDELGPGVVREVLDLAHGAGTQVFFDVGPRCEPLGRDVPAGGRAMLETLVRECDVLLLTEEEAAAVTGCSDDDAVVDALMNHPGSRVDWLVLKKGAEGCLFVTRGGKRLQYPAMSIGSDLMDTVGCGDSLAAAVVLCRIRGHGEEPCAVMANAVGGSTAMHRGAGRNVATAEDVTALLSRVANGDEGATSGSGASAEMQEAAVSALAILSDSLTSADARAGLGV